MHVVHLIDEHGMVRESVLRFPHQVQVGQSRLDHQHVSALKHDVKNVWMFNTTPLTRPWQPPFERVLSTHKVAGTSYGLQRPEQTWRPRGTGRRSWRRTSPRS